MLNHIIIAVLGLVFLGSGVMQPTHKQPITKQLAPKPSPTRFPGVFVNDANGTPKPLHIRQLTASVHVRGTLATTTFEMVVYNPHSRVLEGEFSFPVANGQTVSRFALDINGKMREAVVVDKTKGRQTFEEVIRTKVDPALLEWTRDNSFRARIYPINPQSTRRIIIAYEQQLSKTEDGFGYTIPFAFPERIDTFSFHADVAAFGTRPSLAGNGGDVIAFTPHGRTFIADVYRENILLDKPFSLQVPVALRNNVVSVNNFRGEDYAGIFLTTPPASRQRALPKSISIVWDASLSRLKRDQRKEFEFLTEFFKVAKNVSVSFSVFSNTLHSRSDLTVANGDWTTLRNAIESLKYDGGTQLFSAPLSDARSEIILLFSDGISTFGEHQPSLGKTPVFTISSGVQADHALLHSISDRTGGSFIDLTARGTSDAIASVLEEKLMIREILVLDGTVDDIRPQGAIEVQDVTTITGKLRSSNAKLRFIMSGAIDEEFTAVDVHIDATTQRDDGSAMARLWAQHELQRLSADRNKNAETIKTLGMNFGIVTSGTSLIVLERLEDYVRFNIEPPSTEPELVLQWKSNRAGVQTDSLQKAKRHDEYVKSLVVSEKDRERNRKQQDSSRMTYMQEHRRRDSINSAMQHLPPGSLSGRIVDKDGKPIQGITVKVMGTNRGGFSRSDGTFLVNNIPSTALEVRMTAVGYDTVFEHVQVNSNQVSLLNVVMNAGTIHTRNVQVTANPETRIASENVSKAIARQAGVGNNENDFTVRGSRPEETQVLVDGLRVTDQFTGGLGSVGNTVSAAMPSPFATEEVPAGGWGAEYGNAVGGIVNTRLRRDGRLDGDAGISDDTIAVAAPQSRSLWTDELNKVSSAKLYEWYLEKRAKFFNEASFYLDVADKLIDVKRNGEALRVLSSLAELHGEDSRTLRILAHRLLQIGQTKLAVMVFRDVKNVREEEPQAWRDLGLALTADGQYQEASTMFLYMIDHEWHSRFPEVELIAIHELNRLLRVAGNKIDRKSIPSQYITNAEYDLRVVLSWDADNCDMDLWVTDPDGELCMYNHRFTNSGGCLSRDLTGGYGPEEFILPVAKAGAYKVQVHYYGSRQQTVERPTTIQVMLFKNYNKQNEKQDAVTMRLEGVARVVDVGTITVN